MLLLTSRAKLYFAWMIEVFHFQYLMSFPNNFDESSHGMCAFDFFSRHSLWEGLIAPKRKNENLDIKF